MTQMHLVRAVEDYLGEVSKVLATGQGTAETSYYPALNALLSAFGQSARPRRSALSSPRGIKGSFPDVAVYEDDSNVLVLPVEVKGAAQDLKALAKSAQARRYARVFGGGRVLVTNLWGFALSEIDAGTGKLVERDRVLLIPSAADLPSGAGSIEPGSVERLAAMLEAACATRATMQDPALVARLLAYQGDRMVAAVLDSGVPAKELLAPVAKSLSAGLGMELEDELLVPTTVQTLLYGLFAAWLDEEDPQGFEWVGASYRLTMPVYADMVHGMLTPSFVRRCDLPRVLAAAARLLSWVDRDAFVAAFDGGAIEYFYEPFLAEFDPHLRDKMGVWYTPRPIAEYQVARVDHHLRADLGIANGLADDQVLVLDPACGTGTYLAAVLRRIYETHLANGEPAQVAAQRTALAARERVIGFELLPAAFVVAHINLNRLLSSLGAHLNDDQRVRVYLCNALTGWGDNASQPPQMPLPDLEAEIRAALEVKAEEPVIAIIGNPPYEGYSAAESAEERELLRPWIDDLYQDFGVRKHRLGDLYVRFWRISVQKIADLTDRGVVSLITNRSWLGGRSAPLMRQSVVTRFQKVVIDDLHGGVHERLASDESVFKTRTATGIQVGTAIVTATRTGSGGVGLDQPAEVQVRDLVGPAPSKHETLDRWAKAADQPAAMAEGLTKRDVSRPTLWRLTGSSGDGEEPGADEYIPEFFSGIQPSREELAMDFDPDVLKARMKDYFDKSLTYTELVAKHHSVAVPKSGYDPERVRARYLDSGTVFDSSSIVRFAYRPFDLRYLYWPNSGQLLHRARLDMRASWVDVPGQVAVACPQTARRVGASRPYVTPAVAAFQIADPDGRLFLRLATPRVAEESPDLPMINEDGTSLASDTSDETSMGSPASDEPVTAVAEEWVAAARTSGCSGSDDEIGDRLFYSLVAVMNSPKWVTAQPQAQDDFPGVPLAGDPSALDVAAALGRRIAALSDPDEDIVGVTSGTLDARWAAVGAPDHAPGTVELKDGRAGFSGGDFDRSTGKLFWDRSAGLGWNDIPESVWDFSVAGYQVIPKFLAYRVGRALSQSERERVMYLCRRIAAIQALETECDDAYEQAVISPLSVALAESPPSEP